MSTRRSTEGRRGGFTVRAEGNGNGFLPSHRSSLAAHINKERLTGAPQNSASRAWFTSVFVPIPGAPTRRLRLIVPVPPALARHFARPRTFALAVFVALLVVVNVRLIWTKFKTGHPPGVPVQEIIKNTVTGKDTCVFSQDELRKVWEWEIASGNYPTRRRIPEHMGIPKYLFNPSTPLEWPTSKVNVNQPPFCIDGIDNATIGVGAARTFVAPEAKPPNVAYPPRPIPGSIADLDKIKQFCDYDTEQFVRDCLEFMKVGGGLDNGNRLRRGNVDSWKYIYNEDPDWVAPEHQDTVTPVWEDDPNAKGLGLRHTGSQTLDHSQRPLMQAKVFVPSSNSSVDMCDEERRRIFHMYWSGPFTDKPYLAVMSFLFTQPLNFHLSPTAPKPTEYTSPCSPQMWVWINPGVQASVPNPRAKREMFETLAANPWSAPFLHSRFHDSVKFMMWNTTARLDAHEELRGWREHYKLGELAVDAEAALELQNDEALRSQLKDDQDGTTEQPADGAAEAKPVMDKKMKAALGALKKADSAQVIMSDLARFLICHSFGGVYLDVDHVLLRDWEELWNWRGAFATRWSWHPWYNTAVMKMHKNSALGSLLLNTAVNAKDSNPFHPQAITYYIDDSRTEPLLFRLPDALFDPNFLNWENLQRDRPPFPSYSWETKFEEFFVSPARSGAEPQAGGFDAFFRGAYAYHWHNSWQHPADAGRNFPDLGPKFAATEHLARERAVASKLAAMKKANKHLGKDAESGLWEDSAENDERDLSWSAVLKRTFEAYVRGERPNMYGEWFVWE